MNGWWISPWFLRNRYQKMNSSLTQKLSASKQLKVWRQACLQRQEFGTKNPSSFHLEPVTHRLKSIPIARSAQCQTKFCHLQTIHRRADNLDKFCAICSHQVVNEILSVFQKQEFFLAAVIDHLFPHQIKFTSLNRQSGCRPSLLSRSESVRRVQRYQTHRTDFYVG